MSDLLDVSAPCARGCTWAPANEDEPPRPKPAKHGHLCNSCFYRLTGALKLIPDLMANMRAQLFSLGAADYSERVSGGGDGSPAPLNLGPLDASDALFAKLSTWISLYADEFGHGAPAIPVWMNGREVQGSRRVTVEQATRQASAMVGWIADRLERISGTTTAALFHDDLIYNREDSRGVYSLSNAYGVKAPRPRPEEKQACPLCGFTEVFLSPPDGLHDDLMVLCGRCAWVAEPEMIAPHLRAYEKRKTQEAADAA
jgi:hypothetical protein